MVDKQTYVANSRSLTPYIIFISKYLFKCLDVSFKLIGWFLLLIALRVLITQVDSKIFTIFVYSMHKLYFTSLFLFAFMLLGSTRADIGLPENGLGMALCIIVKVVGFALFWVLTDFTFPLDDVVNKLIEMKIPK